MITNISDSASLSIVLTLVAFACICLVGLLIFQCTSCCSQTDLYKNFVLEGEFNQSTESHVASVGAYSNDPGRTMAEFGMLPPPNEASMSITDETIRPSSSSFNDLAAIVQQKPENFLRPRIRLRFELLPKSSGVILFPNLLHMDRKHLFFLSELGQAWFGPVIDAECNRYGETLRSKVIVRLLSNKASVDLAEKDRLHFLADIQAYKECVDPCVLKLLGLCTTADPYLAVMEATLTDLKTYLRSLLTDGGHRSLEDSLTLKFASQACRGLAVLHEKGFVYQDIGARNCRLTESLVLKIGDYGCTETEHSEDYVTVGDQLVPLRWLAPGNFAQNNDSGELAVVDHSIRTNIWSLGVLLLELCSMARQPLISYTDDQLLNQLATSLSNSNLDSFLIDALKLDAERCACQHSTNSQLWKMHELRNICWSTADRLTASELFDNLDRLFKVALSSTTASSKRAQLTLESSASPDWAFSAGTAGIESMNSIDN